MVSFWFKWLVANIGAVAIADYAIGTTASLLEKGVLRSVTGTVISEIFIFLYKAWTGGILGALFFGSIIGTAQWFVLNTQIPLAKRFILTTALGWVFAGIFTNSYYSGILAGALVGCAQWFVLRGKFLQSGWWIFANILGFGLAGFFKKIAFSQLSPYTPTFDAIADPRVLITVGSTLISSTVTGLALVWLLSRQKKSSSELRIEFVPEYEISNDVHRLANQLLVESFPDYPLTRSYYKLLPQFRYLAWVGDKLVAQMGVEHRAITNNGIPLRIFGLIDLCVASSHQSQKIATRLLQQVEELGKTSGVDFLILFAKDSRIYAKNGYQRVSNRCRWMMVDEHQIIDIGEESMSTYMMVKQIGEQIWQDRTTVDLLGYMF